MSITSSVYVLPRLSPQIPHCTAVSCPLAGGREYSTDDQLSPACGSPVRSARSLGQVFFLFFCFFFKIIICSRDFTMKVDENLEVLEKELHQLFCTTQLKSDNAWFGCRDPCRCHFRYRSKWGSFSYARLVIGTTILAGGVAFHFPMPTFGLLKFLPPRPHLTFARRDKKLIKINLSVPPPRSSYRY